MDRVIYEGMPMHVLSILAHDYPKPSRDELIDFLLTKEKQRSCMTITAENIVFTRVLRVKNIVKVSRAEHFEAWSPGDIIEFSFQLMPYKISRNGIAANVIDIYNKTIRMRFKKSQRVLVKNLRYFDFEEIN